MFALGYHVQFDRDFINTAALARWPSARTIAQLFQQFLGCGVKPLKRLDARRALLHRAEAPVLMSSPLGFAVCKTEVTTSFGAEKEAAKRRKRHKPKKTQLAELLLRRGS
jgi:hypothetical protein